MTQQEMKDFLGVARTAVLSSIGSDGFPHSVAMWFAVDPGMTELRMWAYRKSQKVVNLQRDARCALMVEEGSAYTDLRGILVRGRARVVDDPEEIFAIGQRLYELYTLPATGAAVGSVEEELRRQAGKRKGIVLPLERVASWDHSKL
jgi:PPOX class probable F420-dependent enzyme